MNYHNDEYIYYCEGNIPVVITFPHSGSLKVKGVETRTKGVIHGDDYTDIVARALMNAFSCQSCNNHNNSNNNNSNSNKTCCNGATCTCSTWNDATDKEDKDKDYYSKLSSDTLRPFIVYSKIDRSCCDFNRSAENAYENMIMKHHHDLYHSTIASFINKAKQISESNWLSSSPSHNDNNDIPLWSGRCILLDIHGQSDCPGYILRGTKNMTTVKPLLKRYGIEAIIGESSIFGGLNQRNIPIFPFSVPIEYIEKHQQSSSSTSLPPPPETKSKTQLDQHHEHPRYSGAFTVLHHAHIQSIDSIQIEIGYHYRNSTQVVVDFTRMLRDSILQFNKVYIAPPTPTTTPTSSS